MSFSFILLQLLIFAPNSSYGQSDTLIYDQVLQSMETDSLTIVSDSLNVGSTKSSPIDEIIHYPALDSTVYDVNNQIVKMYNEAKVTYGDITLEANYIAFDFKNKMVLAYGSQDSLGNPMGRPVFSEGSQAFRSDTIRYNFDTKEGLISAVKTDDNESYIHADVSKRHSNEEIHNLGGKYTTCNLDNPHYHFSFKKMIVVPEKKIVTGPVYMKVRKMPIPLALPFGFFPNSNKQKAGILIPSYGESSTLGLYLLGTGYYMPIGDNFDTKITGDIYSRGSWGLSNQNRYIKKYRYTGGLNFKYNSTLSGNPELNTDFRLKTFKVGWTHRQDAKASQNNTFSASVNLGSTQKDRNNFASSTDNYIQNNSNSTVSFAKTWSRMQLSSTVTHNQNSQTGIYNFTLPSLNFSVNRFFLPTGFISRKSIGSQWYDKIAVNYSSRLDNKLLNVTESDLAINRLDQLGEQFINGIQHNINTSTSLKAGPVSINPTINYTQKWHFKRNEKFFNADSLTYDDNAIGGFWLTDDIRFAANMTTKVFGMFQFRGETIKGIRHVMTPTVGFSYIPERNYDIGGFETDTLLFDEYSPYSLSTYNQSSLNESGSVSLSLMNNLEMKVRDRKDTTGVGTKKISMVDNFGISTNYNLLADSLNLANISLTARTKLFDKVDLIYRSSYNPYERSADGTIINEYSWSNGALPALVSNSLSVNMGFRGGSSKKGDKPKSSNANPEELAEIERNWSKFVDFNVPWSFNAQYTLNSTNLFTEGEGYNKEYTQNVRTNGDVRLFELWKLSYNGAYNFDLGKVTSLNLNLHWDLHCWEFVASYIPIGTRRSYNLRLNVKSAILQDLKLQKRKNLEDNDSFF